MSLSPQELVMVSKSIIHRYEENFHISLNYYVFSYPIKSLRSQPRDAGTVASRNAAMTWEEAKAPSPPRRDGRSLLSWASSAEDEKSYWDQTWEKAEKRKHAEAKKKRKKLEYLKKLWDEVLTKDTMLMKGSENPQVIEAKCKKIINIFSKSKTR